MALLFLVYSAPDLALTQLVVEVLDGGALRLRAATPAASSRSFGGFRDRPGALALAVAAGVTMAALTWLAFEVQLAAPISGYFEVQSVPMAHGRNVVNVILVDFRALDTLGEITVLAVAALGVLALLLAAEARRALGGDEMSALGRLEMSTLILRTATRYLVPLLLLFSLFLLWRGHQRAGRRVRRRTRRGGGVRA